MLVWWARDFIYTHGEPEPFLGGGAGGLIEQFGSGILRILGLSMAGVGPDTFTGVRARTKPYVFEGPDS